MDRIPSGATVEKMVATTFLEKNNIVLNLHQADFSQADKIAETINDTFGPEVATPLTQHQLKFKHQKILLKKSLLLDC